MTGAASVVLGWLLGIGAAPAASEATAPEPAPPPTSAPTEAPAPFPTSSTDVEPADGAEPPSELNDPWTTVPLQSVVSERSPAPRVRPPVIESGPRTRASVPLMDPWSSAGRLAVPRQLDPELRDPFGAARASAGPRLAHAELRDPFSARAASATAPRSSAAPAPRRAPSRGPAMTPPPDLRDPFADRAERGCSGPCPPVLPPPVEGSAEEAPVPAPEPIQPQSGQQLGPHSEAQPRPPSRLAHRLRPARPT